MNPDRPARKQPLRSYRLSSPGMYKRIKTEGGVLRKFPLSMRYLQTSDLLESRIGFVIRKRAGDAVYRNVLRRVLRECFRQIKDRFEKPVWIFFEVSDRASETTRTVFRHNAEFLLQTLCGKAA